MRKRILSLLMTTVLTLALAVPAFAASESREAELTFRGIRIQLDGTLIQPLDAAGSPVEPFIYNGSTYLPVRAVAGALGCTVDWDEASSTVTLASGAEKNISSAVPACKSPETVQATLVWRDIQIVLDGQTLEPKDANGEAAEPFIYDGTVYLPVRALADALGCEVEWNEENNAVSISAPVKPLPAPAPDPDSPFGVDLNINMGTIDQWLDRDDVVYRDVRMLADPAAYEDIDGDALLSQTIRGFSIIPYPYVGTLQALPVPGAYDGECLFDVEWAEDGSITKVSANYCESYMILESLFPKDKAIFLMCGGGGYAGMMKTLLIYLGWDENLVYNTGGNWAYTGSNLLTLTYKPKDRDETILATWLADYRMIDFSMLHPAEGESEIIREYDQVILPPHCYSLDSLG